MANLMNGECRCPEFKFGERAQSDPRPCPVPGHPEGKDRPTPTPKAR